MENKPQELDNMFDDPALGRLVDEMDADQSQTSMNEISLYEHNKNNLIQSIPLRISKYHLEFLLEQIPNDDISFWNTLAFRVANYYKLGYLRVYSEQYEVIDNYGKEIKSFYHFLKINMINYFQYNELRAGITRDELEKFINNIAGCPDVMKKCILYITGEEFKAFVKTVILESEEPYTE
jgi:hypothetical protein